jgi:hypothetical protein
MGLRQHLSQFGSTRFWVGLATILGATATLWGTLVGKTVPDLLSSPSPVASFHQAANRACARLPKANTSPYPANIAGSQVGEFMATPSARNLIATDERLSRRIVDPVNEITQALFAIEGTPPQYAAEYRDFEQQWVSVAHGVSLLDVKIEEELYTLYFRHSEWPHQTLPRAHYYRYLAALVRVLDYDERVIREAKQSSEVASIIDTRRCVLMITWVENEAENLGNLLLGFPARPIGSLR